MVDLFVLMMNGRRQGWVDDFDDGGNGLRPKIAASMAKVDWLAIGAPEAEGVERGERKPRETNAHAVVEFLGPARIARRVFGHLLPDDRLVGDELNAGGPCAQERVGIGKLREIIP